MFGRREPRGVFVTTRSIYNRLMFDLQANTFSKMSQDVSSTQEQVKLKNQPFATPEVIGSIVSEMKRAIKNTLPVILRSMQLYLANRETEMVLYRPIKVRIMRNSQLDN